MGQKETRTGKIGKKYHFELSRTSIFLWSAGLFFLLAWIFTLGVLAGRGILPGGVNALTEIKMQIGRLQQMISKEDRSELERIKALQKDPKFAFYDELSVKKAETVQERGASIRKPAPRREAGGKAEVSATRTKYVVQVASLDSEAKATKLVNRLIRQGYPAYAYKVFIKGRPHYRVRCGLFQTREEAVQTERRLAKSEKLKGFVKRVKSH